MPYVALGIEHKTAPLPIREKAAMDEGRVLHAREELVGQGVIEELVVLSTCNRSELYMFAPDVEAAAAAATYFFSDLDPILDDYLIRRDEIQVAEHLFRIASGLESQTLGETQVLSQVREAFQSAQDAGTAGTHLHALFRAAIACAKHARSGTKLGEINTSIAAEAVAMASDELQGLSGKSALLIGGGEVARLAAAELHALEVKDILVTNRTASVANALASTHGAAAVPFDALKSFLPHVDLVITATASSGYVLRREDFEEVDDRGVTIYDLAIPRDVDPEVGSLPGVRLHDLDSVLPVTLDEHWQEDIRTMESVIAAELHDFRTWYLIRRVVPVIANLRSHVEAVSAQELERIEPQLEGLSAKQREAVEKLTNRLVDKMFHHLVTRLRLAAQTDPQLVDAAEFFFLHGEGGLFEHAAESKERHEIEQR